MAEDNPLFKKFIPELKTILLSNESTKVGTQSELLKKLLAHEDEFRQTLLSTEKGRAMYSKFIEFVIEEKGNALTYAVYFREDGDMLLKAIKKIFKDKDHKEERDLVLLMSFRINYMFVKWIVDRYRGPKKKILAETCEKICSIRKSLCEENLPLAINRAKLFFIKRQDLDYMDMIQSASEGLTHAIDKFTPNRGDFAGVATGRMMVHMDNDGSRTMIKLPPKDRRILYRYNNAVNKEKLISDEDILAYVRQSFKGVTMDSMQALVRSVSTMVSIDEKREDSLSILEKTSSGSNPEDETMQMDLKFRLRKCISLLTVPERKVVRLKNNL